MAKKNLTSKGVAHLVGTPITIDNRTIQRCLICGFKILDNEDPIVNIVVDEKEAKFYTWDVGSWIRVNKQSAVLLFRSDYNIFKLGEIPDNSCLGLVE